MAPAVEVRQLTPGDLFQFEYKPEKRAEVLAVGSGMVTVIERHGRKHVKFMDPHDRTKVLREFEAEDKGKPYSISPVTRVHPAGRSPAWSDTLDSED